MENIENFDIYFNKEIPIDSLASNEKTFLNKKRKEPKELSATAGFDLDEHLEGNLNKFITNVNSSNNINFEKPEQSSLIQSIKKNEKNNYEDKTTFTTLTKLSNLNDENKNNFYTEINENIPLQEENDINPLLIKEKTTKSKEKKVLPCFALDLLNKNGEFQIKFSQKLDSAYILKIKEVEIDDKYYEQLDYAKSHGKFSKLKYTAPNNLFWQQRYYYFSKFDKGIQMDKESWYSVTPEEIAKYTAELIKGKTIIDGFCGCGGNVIQFSKYCSHFYAIDISEDKLNMCKNNCKVYHCKDNIKFIHSDFLEMKNKIKADYIFLSPPWGGTEYKNSEVYSIKKFMFPDITDIVRVSLNVADNIIFFLPRNLDLDELFDICSTVRNEIKEGFGKNIFFDIRIIKSNGRIKSLMIIFGHHIKDYFSKHKLENFVKINYGKYNDKYINDMYSTIKAIGCYQFFREEYNYRTIKGDDLSNLNEYIKSKSNRN